MARPKRTVDTTDDIVGAANSWRAEVRQLFGLRWDNFVEWVIVFWASAWLWSSWAVSNALVFPKEGPIEWVGDILHRLAVEPPHWLLEIPRWLTTPDRSWLLWVFQIGAAIFATLAVRSYRHSGLRIMALICLRFAFEVNRSVLPLLWVTLFALIPPGAALIASVVAPDSRGIEDEGRSFFYPKGIVERYLPRVLGLFLFPVIAPGVVFVELVNAYKTVPLYHPSSNLASRVAMELQDRPKSLAEVDALTALSALVSAVSASQSLSMSQKVADIFDYHVKQRRGY
jgi:hypothetical protein